MNFMLYSTIPADRVYVYVLHTLATSNDTQVHSDVDHEQELRN